MAFTPPPGAQPNEQGFYVDAGGNLLPGQTTPGMAAADKAGLTPQYDPKKGLWFTKPGGKVNYISPVVMQGPNKTRGTTPDTGGGLVNKPSWNNQTGKWDNGLNWGNIMSLAVGGVLTWGMAYALMGGGEAASAALSSAGVPGGDVASAGLGGFLGDGAVIGGVPAALPGAVESIPGLAGVAGAGASTAPVLEGISAGPGATTVPQAGIGPTLGGGAQITPGLPSGLGVPGAEAGLPSALPGALPTAEGAGAIVPTAGLPGGLPGALAAPAAGGAGLTPWPTEGRNPIGNNPGDTGGETTPQGPLSGGPLSPGKNPYLSAIPLLASLIPGLKNLFSGPGNNPAGDLAKSVGPDFQSLIALQNKQAHDADPLHMAILAMGQRLVPQSTSTGLTPDATASIVAGPKQHAIVT